MAGTADLQGVRLGTGLTKVVVPVVAPDRDQILTSASEIRVARPDLVEWRADLFDGDDMPLVARQLVAQLGTIPVIATIRSSTEGGAGPSDPEEYLAAVEALVQTGVFAAVDVEVGFGGEVVARACAAAHDAGIAVIGSHHDLTGTPDVPLILDRLRSIAATGVDVCKVAVTAHGPADALALLDATLSATQELRVPVVTMAMGPHGVVTRLAGGVFGSAATFAKVGRGSAPGQVGLDEARQVLSLLDDR